MSILSVIIGNIITLVCGIVYIKYRYKHISLDNFAEKIVTKLRKDEN